MFVPVLSVTDTNDVDSSTGYKKGVRMVARQADRLTWMAIMVPSTPMTLKVDYESLANYVWNI